MSNELDSLMMHADLANKEARLAGMDNEAYPLELAREVVAARDAVMALLCGPGEATEEELVSVISDLGATAEKMIEAQQRSKS